MRDDAADAAVAADDVVILMAFQHTFKPAPLRARFGRPPSTTIGGQEREGIERRADAAQQQDDGEHLAGPTIVAPSASTVVTAATVA